MYIISRRSRAPPTLSPIKRHTARRPDYYIGIRDASVALARTHITIYNILLLYILCTCVVVGIKPRGVILHIRAVFHATHIDTNILLLCEYTLYQYNIVYICARA